MKHSTLSFVACASNLEVLTGQLLRSACLQDGSRRISVHFHCTSAAQGFNASLLASQDTTWLVWVHQDVFLPPGWDLRFEASLAEASQKFPHLAVAGVYGVAGHASTLVRAGHVLDRGATLQEAESLPCLVDSLDELLIAVRVDSGLRFDPALGFDFYGTDIVLQAQERGLQCAVLDAYCEHWSNTPRAGALPPHLIERVRANGAAFERKWIHRLPLTTPCFEVDAPGSVARSIEHFIGLNTTKAA